jgi:hypothetical protein
MNASFGPWATAMPSGSNLRLSTFWRQRMTRLASSAQRDPSSGRPAMTVLAILAAVLVPIPASTETFALRTLRQNR